MTTAFSSKGIVTYKDVLTMTIPEIELLKEALEEIAEEIRKEIGNKK